MAYEVARPLREDIAPKDSDGLGSRRLEERDHAVRIQRRLQEWEFLTRDHQGSWMEAIQHLAGRQDYYWSAKLHRLRPEPALPRKSDHQANFIMRLVETLISILTREDPVPIVSPTNGTYSAWEKAENTSLVLQHDFRMTQYADVRDLVYRWLLVTGMGWIRWGWDPRAGDRVQQQMFDVIENKEGYYTRKPAVVDGRPVTVDGFTGQPYVRAVSPFNMVFDMAALNLHERGVQQPRFIMEQNLWPLDAVEDEYPDVRGKLRPDGVTSIYGHNYMKELMLGTSASYSGGAYEAEHLVLVVDEWTPRTALYGEERKRYPDGRVVRYCQQFLLGDPVENPLGGRIPYVPFVAYPIPGRFLPQGLVPHMISAQIGYNRMSRKEEEALIYSVVKLVVPSIETQGESHMRAEQGEIIRVNPRDTGGMLPSYLMPPTISNQYELKKQSHRTELEDIAAIKEAIQGENPTGGRSGRLAFANIQANLLSHGRLEKSLARRHREVFEGLAYVEQSFGYVTRTFSIAGVESMAAQTMRPTDAVEYTDITIKEMSALSLSEPALHEFVMGLWTTGALIDDFGRPDVHELRRLLKIGVRSEIFHEEMMARRNTRWEIEQVESGQSPTYGPGPDGQPLLVRPGLNMEIAHKVYKDYFNSDRYMGQPPPIQRALLDRWDMLIMSLQMSPPGGIKGPGASAGGGVSATSPGPTGPAGGGPGGSKEEAGLFRTLSSRGQGGP